MADVQHFNPRSPCGERPPHAFAADVDRAISIHAPLAGSDDNRTDPREETIKFQSTLPLRGATCTIISVFSSSLHFNPRSPCGERQEVDEDD